jgi:predicted exporter
MRKDIWDTDMAEGRGTIAWLGVFILAGAVTFAVSLWDWRAGILSGLLVIVLALLAAGARKDNPSW